MASSTPSSAKSGSSGRGSSISKTPPNSAGKKSTSNRTTSGSSSDSAVGKSQKFSKPSDKLNPKTIDPFASSKKTQSAFAAVYANGGVPCRLVHGSVKHKIAWDTPPELVQFDPILVTLAEGLKETVHPYTFVSRTGFKELLEVQGSGDKAVQVLPKIVLAVRSALSHSDPSVFEAGLEATLQLSDASGPALNQHLKTLLVPISKKMMDKKYRDRVTDALQRLEQNGGRDALPVIKAKAPTYSSIFG